MGVVGLGRAYDRESTVVPQRASASKYTIPIVVRGVCSDISFDLSRSRVTIYENRPQAVLKSGALLHRLAGPDSNLPHQLEETDGHKSR